MCMLAIVFNISACIVINGAQLFHKSIVNILNYSLIITTNNHIIPDFLIVSLANGAQCRTEPYNTFEGLFSSSNFKFLRSFSNSYKNCISKKFSL